MKNHAAEQTWGGSTRYLSTFLKYSYSYSYNLWVMYSYSYSDFTSTLQVHLSIFSMYAVKMYLFVVNKMNNNTLLFLITMTMIPPSPRTSRDGYPPTIPTPPWWHSPMSMTMIPKKGNKQHIFPVRNTQLSKQLQTTSSGYNPLMMYQHVNWSHVVFIQNKGKQTLLKFPHIPFVAIWTNLLTSTPSNDVHVWGG